MTYSVCKISHHICKIYAVLSPSICFVSKYNMTRYYLFIYYAALLHVQKLVSSELNNKKHTNEVKTPSVL